MTSPTEAFYLAARARLEGARKNQGRAAYTRELRTYYAALRALRDELEGNRR